MKIERTGSSASARGVAPAKSSVRGDEAAAPNQAHVVDDVTSVLGIPEGELTPKVRQAIIQLLGEVEQLRRELREAQARLHHLEKLADQDTLAPMANRRAFIRELSRVISFSHRYKLPSSVLFFDLNGMKSINDTYGHAAGDAALLHVASVLIENVRGSDFVGRLGGDEFGVILANADQGAANEKAQMLVRAIEARSFVFEGHAIPITLAFGAYSFQPGEDPTSALANADRAMYANKQQARQSA